MLVYQAYYPKTLVKLKEYIVNAEFWSNLFMAAASYLLWVSLFIWGARMTIMSHAELFSSLSGSFIILYKLGRR